MQSKILRDESLLSLQIYFATVADLLSVDQWIPIVMSRRFAESGGQGYSTAVVALVVQNNRIISHIDISGSQNHTHPPPPGGGGLANQ